MTVKQKKGYRWLMTLVFAAAIALADLNTPMFSADGSNVGNELPKMADPEEIFGS